MKGLQIKHLRAYGLGATITAACAALVVLPVQPAAATVRLGQPTTDGGNFPSLFAIEPGRHPALHISTPVNIVFVGYRPDAVDVGRIRRALPSVANPPVRVVSDQDVGLRYDYRYRRALRRPRVRRRVLRLSRSTAAWSGPIDPVHRVLQRGAAQRLDVGPQEAYIDANSTEAWLEPQSAARLGIARRAGHGVPGELVRTPGLPVPHLLPLRAASTRIPGSTAGTPSGRSPGRGAAVRARRGSTTCPPVRSMTITAGTSTTPTSTATA